MLLAQVAGDTFQLPSDQISVALLMVRVVIGLTIAAHGYGKFFRGGKIPGTAGWFDSMGMKPGKLHAYMAASTEVGGGLMFAAGLITPLAAASIVALMFVATWTVHRENGFFIVGGGWEYNFVLAAMAVAVAVAGAGRYSLDNSLNVVDDLDGWSGLIIAVGIGLGSAIGQLAIFFHPPESEPDAETAEQESEPEATIEEPDSGS